MSKLGSLEFEFNLRTRARFGAGSATKLGEYLKELSFERIGIIIDQRVHKTDYGKRVLKSVEEKRFDTVKVWVYNLGGEPDYDSLDQTKPIFMSTNYAPSVDCFVGIGGGSVMDFAKGLATLVVNPGKAIEYRGFPENVNPSLPTIAVPTTAGTGSEVTYNAVFVDLADKKKLGINTMHNFPVSAILDPNLTLSCPKSVTVSSGMDALVHTLESYAARRSNPLTKIFARGAFKLIFNNLFKVLGNPKNIEIRANLQLGAYFAGISLMNSGSGPAGALSYPLGVHFNVPHGYAGAVFLPHVVKFNVGKNYDYGELHDLIDNVDKSIGRKKKNILFAEKLFELCNSLGVPSSIRKFGVNENNINILLKETENLGNAFAQNPIPFSVEDGKKLLMEMV